MTFQENPIRQNPIVSNEELNTIYEQMVFKSNETNLNPYDTYIEECKRNNLTQMDSQEERVKEKHHIIPLFDQGADVPENIIR